MSGFVQSGRFGGAWTPASISAAVWLDSSDAATITSSGGAVSSWANKGSAGGSFDQSTAGKNPTTGGSTQNSLNVVTFDGGDFLTCDLGSDVLGVTSWYVWAVAKADAGANYPRLFAGHVSATGAADYQSPNAIFAYLDSASTGASSSQVKCYSAGTAGTATAAHMGVSAYKVIGSRRHSGNIYSHLAGTLTTGTAATAPSTLRYLRIGSWFLFDLSGGANFWKGGLAELVMIADGNPAAGDITAVTDYFAAKWAV